MGWWQAPCGRPKCCPVCLGDPGLAEADAALLAELFDEPPGLLGVVMPLKHGALQPGGDVDHRSSTIEGLAQIERLVFGAVVSGTAAGGLAAAAGHDNEAAV